MSEMTEEEQIETAERAYTLQGACEEPIDKDQWIKNYIEEKTH